MKIHVLERTQIVRRPLAETFDFFCDPHNLQRLTPAFLNFRFLEPPNKFVDVQEKGPYALWRHRHTFSDAGHGRTEVKDFVEYALPLWPLGETAYYLFVARSLAQIFDYRERELAAIIAAESRGSLAG